MRRALSVLCRDVVINGIIGSKAFPRGLRWIALRAVGVNVGRCSINAGVFFGGRDVHIGRDTFINYETFIDNAARVRIGERVSIGPRVMILTGTHELGGIERVAGPYTSSPVDIGDGVWIGAGAIILPGVTIGPGALIAAGAVVTRDCTTPGIYAGVPAHMIRAIEDMGAPRESSAVDDD